MNSFGIPLLSIATWLPAIGALLMLFVRERSAQRLVALVASLAALVAALVVAVLFFQFLYVSAAATGPQLTEQIGWVPTWGLTYTLTVDGISLWFFVLTAFMMPFAIAATRAQQRPDANYALLLLLETGILGTFLARDLILFYAFFEFTLIPTALLLGIWGGAERNRAATKFFLYTFAGSVFMLLSIIGLYLVHGQQTGTYTFDYAAIAASLNGGAGAVLKLDPAAERLLFGGFFIAFAIKIALWPFHTWMPLLHSQTPADGSVDISAVLLKVIGGYGLIRFTLGLFPQAAQWAAPAIGVLAVIGILYGAWVAYTQQDMKALLAYSSVSHLSFVVLGIYALNAQGISGAIIQLVNYGITTSALFLAVAVLEGRFGTRRPRDLGGLWLVMPAFGAVTLTLVLASVGLPGLNGFIGEFTIIQGAWLSSALGWRFVGVAVIGVILAAVYLLTMFKHVFMGSLRVEQSNSVDISREQMLPLALLLIPIVVIGFYPNLIFDPIQPIVQQISQALSLAVASR
ncbi:MAG: NADH-quinone oxidoreductase subunit M [Roseiflexaceae bacterium]|nr:NADH-quinone oxidoreductase subunit M [Roseiflexaceae bacterium]